MTLLKKAEDRVIQRCLTELFEPYLKQYVRFFKNLFMSYGAEAFPFLAHTTKPPRTCNKQQRGVHNRGSVQHGGHEDVVAGAVHEAHMPHQLEAAGARGPQTREVVVFARRPRDEAGGPRAFGVVAFVDLCVRVTCGRDGV